MFVYHGGYVTSDSSDSDYSSDEDEVSQSSNKFRNSDDDEKNDEWVGQDESRALTESMGEVSLTPMNEPDQGVMVKKMQQEKDELLREIKRLEEDNANLEDRLKCPACHDVKEDLYLAMTCGHKICFECYEKWGNKCATCRTKLKKESKIVKRLYL
mmetsp:Transcript_5301/g.9368  ORF Transcript_5301/g.9368 Transcript_5301/m.9368 type:complete len:156 (-) Transcript_5301:241-708(-)